jgi:hypothetical protein
MRASNAHPWRRTNGKHYVQGFIKCRLLSAFRIAYVDCQYNLLWAIWRGSYHFFIVKMHTRLQFIHVLTYGNCWKTKWGKNMQNSHILVNRSDNKHNLYKTYFTGNYTIFWLRLFYVGKKSYSWILCTVEIHVQM